MTTVVRVRPFRRREFEAAPGFVYVGRAAWGWAGSPFANPFRVADGYPAEAAARDFERAFLDAGRAGPFAEMRRRLPELRGKRLGCWCVDWDGRGEPAQPCHAVVLARMADGPLGEAVRS